MTVKEAVDGTCDIGMASREPKESGFAKLTPIQIAIDGIAVIVNKDNPLGNLSKEQLQLIYTNDAVKWSKTNK